jgi:CRP-like cAMP-binding protein
MENARLYDDSSPSPLKSNHLLAALPPSRFYRLLPHFELVAVNFRQSLYGDTEEPEYAYFPTDSVASLVSTMSDGKSVELAMIGNDGATGVFGLFGAVSTYYEYRVQIPGRALRIRADALRQELEVDGVLPLALMRYIPALCAQISQVAACNRLHKVEQRLSTWLTMMHDRVKGDEIALRQSDIADTLGYRRPTITEACIQLQERGAVRYSRGRINVIDRERLQEAACECYAIMESQAEKALQDSWQEMLQRKRPVRNLFVEAARMSERTWREQEIIRLRCQEQMQIITEQREWLKGLGRG